MIEINYHELLKKYMSNILMEEGTTFIWDKRDQRFGSDSYTEAEHAVLKKLKDKLYEEEEKP